MSGEILSVQLPARFLSAGQGPVPGWQAASVTDPDALLLIVRETGSETGSDGACRQVLVLPYGASLPDGFRTAAPSRWYWIRFRSAAGPESTRVSLSRLPLPLSETAFNRFSYSFHQLLRESGGLPDLSDYMLSVLLLTLQENSTPAPRTAVAARLLEYIRVHCCEPLTLPDIARALGYSEDYLSHLLHEQVSCSFRRYVHLLRMQRAKKELLSGFRSIREIAEECGYTNAKFFSTSFLKYEGITPSAFRNLYASGPVREDSAS